MLHEGTTGKSVFQSTDIRERKKSEGKEISVEELGGSRVTESERPGVESEGQQKKREVFVAHNGEEKQVAPLRKGKHVETNERAVEPPVNDDEKEEQDVANDGATLSEDELLSIRWKKTGNLTTYLHNLATFLGNFPNLNVELDEKENVSLVFPCQLQVIQISADQLLLIIPTMPFHCVPNILQLETTLSSMASKDTNSVDKIQLAEKQVLWLIGHVILDS